MTTTDHDQQHCTHELTARIDGRRTTGRVWLTLPGGRRVSVEVISANNGRCVLGLTETSDARED